jgi:hypothetical protein
MRQKDCTLATQLSVKECAEAFKKGAADARTFGAKVGGVIAKLNRSDNSGFFTPKDNSPFSELEEDKPAFAVGVFIPRFANSAHGNVSAIHMYVWDRGDFREVVVMSPHTFGNGSLAKRQVKHVTNALRAADPNLEIAA